MTALEFSEVRFRYTAESPLLLDGLSFRVEAGEFVSILGPSGAGKSSLFRLMNGLLAPESASGLFSAQSPRPTAESTSATLSFRSAALWDCRPSSSGNPTFSATVLQGKSRSCCGM